jgi:putative aminopeptidase FrvX
MTTEAKPWTEPMPEAQFEFMRRILAAPSPIGLEGAMTFGVLEPEFNAFKLGSWAAHRFAGNAGIVFDTHPGETDRFTVMLVGHADKIRMQVRSIGEDGKIWIDSDSFMPSTLLGHEVRLFSENPETPGRYRVIEGGTIEAVGAIHFADAALRGGDRGIKPTMLYVELQVHGEKRREQIEKLGIRSGDSVILHRPIRRGFSPNTFYGAYLDNGLGCFVTMEVCRLLAQRGGLKNIRVLGAIAPYEEIGRLGSRVLAGAMRPDAVIAIDVNHDYEAAPGIGDRRFNPLSMGKGFTLSVGSIVSEALNGLVEGAARERGVPYQKSVVGIDTGTDAMAAVFASIDAASTSIGFPIRNMHTISESGHTGDVLASVHGIEAALQRMDAFNEGRGIKRDDLKQMHPRLDEATPLRRDA